MENNSFEGIGINRKKKIIVAAVVTFGLVLCLGLAHGIRAYGAGNVVEESCEYHEAIQ